MSSARSILCGGVTLIAMMLGGTLVTRPPLGEARIHLAALRISPCSVGRRLEVP
jgi:hypothetical protein